MKVAFALSGIAVAALAGSAMAGSVSLGGYVFDDTAFADSLTGSAGNWTTAGGSLAASLTGSDASDYAFSFDAGSFAALAFTDNVALNGAGADLVVFELGVDDFISLTINGITHNYLTSSTGETAGGFSLNAAAIDLSDYGVGSVSNFSLNGGVDNGGTVASYTVIGALHVPAPASAALLGLGGLAISRRRR